ncbi:MAG: creatininase [Desulfobacterales bacterium]|nr:creatininase [Desulfobacterales bacterium]
MLVEHITWEEYRDEVGRRIIILPVGSLEQHGPHLPMNVDVVIPKNLATMTAEQVESLVLPPIAYGYKSHPTSGGGQLFPGTTSLDGTTLINLTLDILRETYRHGGRRFLILNGHYENVSFLTEAVELFIREADGARVVILSWWDQVSDEMVDKLFAEAGFPGWDTEHAAITETSLMLYFSPELVREDKIIDDQSERKPTYSIFPPPDDIIPKSGVLYKATYASREKGEELAKHVVDKIVKVVSEELS